MKEQKISGGFDILRKEGQIYDMDENGWREKESEGTGR